MKRTLLAIGIAVLVSLMLVPYGSPDVHSMDMWLPFFISMNWLPESWNVRDDRIMWTPFILQTVFVAVAAAVIVNLFPRRPRK